MTNMPSLGRCISCAKSLCLRLGISWFQNNSGKLEVPSAFRSALSSASKLTVEPDLLNWGTLPGGTKQILGPNLSRSKAANRSSIRLWIAWFWRLTGIYVCASKMKGLARLTFMACPAAGEIWAGSASRSEIRAKSLSRPKLRTI